MALRIISFPLGFFLFIGGALFFLNPSEAGFVEVFSGINFILLGVYFSAYSVSGKSKIKSIIEKVSKTR